MFSVKSLVEYPPTVTIEQHSVPTSQRYFPGIHYSTRTKYIVEH